MKYVTPSVSTMASCFVAIRYTDLFNPFYSEIDSFVDTMTALFPAYEADD